MTELMTPTRLRSDVDGFFATKRKDAWWLVPALQFSLLAGFIIYSLWAAWINTAFEVTHYRSPLYAVSKGPSWWPTYLSPAFLLIWAPIGFRATCYYARKVYYRVFLFDPPACAVGEFRNPKKNYKGEKAFPWVLNNLHRYFWYAAAVLMILHWLEFFRSIYNGGNFGFGIGTFLLALDVVFLTLYVMSCHAAKHLFSGGRNCYSCTAFGKTRYKTWSIIRKLNINHNWYFWISLITTWLFDLYVKLLFYTNFNDYWWQIH